MQLQQILCFVSVVDQGTFTRAAAHLHLTQPSLSTQIRNLEGELATRLFDRGRSGVALTATGEALLPYARRILADIDSAKVQIADLNGLRAGRVRVGALPSLCTTLLADSLGFFHRRLPAVQLVVEEAASRHLVQHLAAGLLDLAIIVLPLQRDDPDLVTHPLLTEDLVVAVAASSPRDAATSMTVEDLRNEALVMFREGYDLRSTTLAACRAAGFEPRFAVEGGDMDAVLSFVESGLGVAVVPALAVRGRPSIRAVPFDPPTLSRTIGVAHLRSVALSRSAAEFRNTIVQTAAAIGFHATDYGRPTPH